MAAAGQVPRLIDLGELQDLVTSAVHRARREFRIVTHQHLKRHRDVYHVLCSPMDPLYLATSVWYFDISTSMGLFGMTGVYDTSMIFYLLLACSTIVNNFLPTFTAIPLMLLRRVINMACTYPFILLAYDLDPPTFVAICLIIVFHCSTVFSKPSHMAREGQQPLEGETDSRDLERGSSERQRVVESNTVFFVFQFILHSAYTLFALKCLALAGATSSPVFWCSFFPLHILRFIVQSRGFVAAISDFAVEPKLDKALCFFAFVDTFWGRFVSWVADDSQAEQTPVAPTAAFHHNIQHDE